MTNHERAILMILLNKAIEEDAIQICDRSKSGQGHEPADFAFENDEYDSELNVMVHKVILMCGEIKQNFTKKKPASKAKRKGVKR
jgi:hypothetical protein